MAHYLPLASYPQLYHPHHQPGNPSIQPHSASALASLTSYTNQFILSADEHEAKLAALYQKFGDKRDEALEKMDEKENEKDTAYLIEKTDQQTFVSFVVGVVLTGLLYTGLLIFKPSADCKKEKEEERGLVLLDLENTVEDSVLTRRTRSVTGSSLACAVLSSPFISAVMIVWLPIVLQTLVTGFMVREVELLEKSEEDDFGDDTVDIGNIADADSAQFVTSDKLKAPTMSRYDLYNSEQFHNLAF